MKFSALYIDEDSIFERRLPEAETLHRSLWLEMHQIGGGGHDDLAVCRTEDINTVAEMLGKRLGLKYIQITTPEPP